MGTLIYHPRWMATIQRKPPLVVSLKRATTVQAIVDRRRPLRRHTYRLPDHRREFLRPTLCRVNGRDVPRREWRTLRIGARDVVQFVDLPPKLKGGGNTFLNIGALVLSLAVAVAAPEIAPLLIGGATSGLLFSATVAGITLAGGLLAYGLVSLFAQPQPVSNNSQTSIGDSSTPVSPTYTLSAQGNNARLGQPIPELFGRVKMYPDQAGTPYARYVGNEQYLHQLLVITVGYCQVEQILIGDTPIESFSGDIAYEVCNPGTAPSGDIVDARWLVSTDMGEPQLDGSEAGSPTIGPFFTNPPGTVTSDIELDFVNPRGLYHVVSSGGSTVYESVHVTIVIAARYVDDDGNPLGGYFTIDALTLSGNSPQPYRWSQVYNLAAWGGAGRYQVTCQRVDHQEVASDYGHVCNWTGLRSIQAIAPRVFADVTTLAIRMRATGGITSLNSRKVAVVATRKHYQWDGAQFLGTMVATRNPTYAFAYIARARNGARLPDSSIDLAGIFALHNEFEDVGWTFDYVFDSTVDCSEALRRVAAAVVGERIVQGSKLCLVRDVAPDAPVMMFHPRNIAPGSLQIDYAMVDSTSSDGVTGQYIDPTTWKPRELTVAYPDSAQERLTTYQAYGVTDRDQLAAVLTNLVRGSRLRRRIVSFDTEMEGLALQFGDGIALSYDFPSWGQTAEILDWNAVNRIATVSEALEWTVGSNHYIQVRDELGQAHGPFPVDQVEDQPMQVLVGAGSLPDILTGGDRERTVLQFGPGTAYAKPLKVKGVTPAGDHATVLAFDDDAGMYEAVGSYPDPGRSPDLAALTVAVAADTSDLNLRTLADAAGYSGSLVQAVTIRINAGVTVSASTAALAAVQRGSWPAGFQPTLENRGHIDGYDAAGGAMGGTALDTRTGALEVDNVGGRLRGGDTGGYAVQGSGNVTWTGVDTGERVGGLV